MHNTPFRTSLIALAVLTSMLGLVLSACAAPDPVLQEPPTTGSDGGDVGSDGDDVGVVLGEPADPESADRVIEIDAMDSFEYDPSDLTVSVGETVTFRVTDTGSLPHDFALGSERVQDQYESDSDRSMKDEPSAFSISAGETMELTWEFTDPGEILFACHQPGHYAAGMKGTITVEG